MRQNTDKRVVRDSRPRSGLALGALVVVAAFVLAACSSGDSGGDKGSTTTTKAKSTTTTAPKNTGDRPATTTTTAVPASATSLDGKSFIATGVEGYEPVPDSDLTITFEDGQMSVNGGCNTLGSGYTFTKGTLKWTGVPRATMMACSEPLEAQDAWLTDLFTTGVDAVLDEDTLTLTSGDVTITMESVADAPLTNTTWTLQNVIAAGSTAALPGGDAATLTIDDDAKIAVNTGCNTGSGTVEIADTTLTFSAIALTKKLCEGDAGAVENYVVTTLDGETTYTVEGDTLTIMKGAEQGLIYTAS